MSMFFFIILFFYIHFNIINIHSIIIIIILLILILSFEGGAGNGFNGGNGGSFGSIYCDFNVGVSPDINGIPLYVLSNLFITTESLSPLSSDILSTLVDAIGSNDGPCPPFKLFVCLLFGGNIGGGRDGLFGFL